MAAWTTPDTSPTGQFTAARWDTYIRDNLIYLHDLALLQVTNDSGVAVALGSVVVLDLTADGMFIVTTTVGDARIAGVAQGAIADGALGYVAVLGRVNSLLVTGAVGRQQPLQTSATAQRAQEGAGNAFATALTAAAGPGSGSISAFVHNRGSIAAHVIKDLTATFAQRTNLRFGDGLNVEDVPGSDETLVTAGWPVEPVSATHGPAGFHITDAALHANEIAAPGAGFALVITKIAIWNRVATANTVTISENGGGGYSAQPTIGAVIGAGTVDAYQGGWQLQEDTGVDIQCSAVGDVFIEIEFFTKAV